VSHQTLRQVRIDLPGPLDVGASLAGLGRWGDDLIDRWDGSRWLRVVGNEDHPIPVRVTPLGDLDMPALEVTAASPGLDAAARQLAGAFVQSGAELEELAVRDPVIADVNARFPGVRPLLTLDPLTALVRSISAQQVNLRWAAEIRRRLAIAYGRPLEIAGEVVHALEPAALASTSVESLRALQLTTTKARSVIAVARAALEGELVLAELAALDDASVIHRLVRIHGIGTWSAEWFLARTLGRPRVVAGDLGVRKAVGLAYFGGRMPSEQEVRTCTDHWGAAAGVAQQLLLQTLLNPGRSVPPAP
jgi:DNA-3-methyladenine glycosylase II